MKQKKYTIAVLGTKTPVGKEILAELDRQNYPVEQIQPLDLHQEAGCPISYQNRVLVSSALDLFDLTQPHILFLCDPRIFERYPHHFLHGKNWLIDCTRKIQKAACIIPELNGQNINCLRTKCLCVPNSAAIAIARCLKPIHEKYHLISAQTTAVLGAWYAQPNLVDPLLQQTRHCFAQTPVTKENIYPMLAFNLIPDFFKDISPLIYHQLKCFLPSPVQLHTCFAPVLRGGTFFVQAILEQPPHINGIRSLFQQKSFCQLLDSSQHIGTHDLLAEDKLYIQNIEINKNTVSFWLMQDPLQTGFIANAVQILSILIK